MKQIRWMLVILLVIALLPLQTFAVTDGRRITEQDMKPFDGNLPYTPVLLELVFDEEGMILPYTSENLEDVGDLHERTWIDQYTLFAKEEDADPEDTYLVIVRKDETGKTAYLFTIIEGEVVKLLELPHPDFFNYFRSNMAVSLYTDGVNDYADVTISNNFPATDEGPSTEEEHRYFVLRDGTAEPAETVDGALISAWDGGVMQHDFLQFSGYLASEYEAWKELYRLGNLSFTDDTMFLEGISQEEEEDFLISLIPLFSDRNCQLRDGFGLGVAANLMRFVAEGMAEELAIWEENALTPSGNDGYYAMEKALLEANRNARQMFALGMAENGGWVLDSKPFADYMMTRYNQPLSEGAYAPEETGVSLAVDREGVATAAIDAVMLARYIFPETMEARGDYAILKATVCGFWGGYAAEGIHISETGYFLLHKVESANGTMIQTIYRSDDAFTFEDVKDLTGSLEEAADQETSQEKDHPDQGNSGTLMKRVPLIAGVLAVLLLVSILLKRRKR